MVNKAEIYFLLLHSTLEAAINHERKKLDKQHVYLLWNLKSYGIILDHSL